ncbi:MAG: hypothetical protein HOV80_18630 [Polyangiaceae bacterium]|nr:hypothetical protein [Polyangiaceae bacterium]
MSEASWSDPQAAARTEAKPKSERVPESERDVSLKELLEETRIILPGTEVLLGFLVTLPFTQHFSELTQVQRTVYLCTFFSTLSALLMFMLPAAYHRIARPIHQRLRFKRFANYFLVGGLAPLSVGIVLVTWLVTSVVMPSFAMWGAGGVAILVLVAWWIVPLARVHDQAPREG